MCESLKHSREPVVKGVCVGACEAMDSISKESDSNRSSTSFSTNLKRGRELSLSQTTSERSASKGQSSQEEERDSQRRVSCAPLRALLLAAVVEIHAHLGPSLADAIQLPLLTRGSGSYIGSQFEAGCCAVAPTWLHAILASLTLWSTMS